ncbi:hypothetical protein QP150_10440 [Sphingomonas sp. 22L2VL55-3]
MATLAIRTVLGWAEGRDAVGAIVMSGTFQQFDGRRKRRKAADTPTMSRFDENTHFRSLKAR